MKVLILPDAQSAAQKVADLTAQTIIQRGKTVLGLATGSTMERVYADLIARHKHNALSFAEVTTFNLDEYIPLGAQNPQSYHQTMAQLLFSHVDIAPHNTHLPRGDAGDLEVEAARYEQLIANAGGIDVQLLGIGQNGHIGFNEPTSSLGGRTRIKTLTRQTRKANARFFADPEDVPRHAITMGIGNILEARHCVLLALGTGKAQAVARMIEGPLGADCPATALQLHPKATIVLDRDAANALKLLDYYQDIHPDGEEPKIGRFSG